MAERAEQELLVVERENIVKVGKEEKQRVKLDTEFVKKEIKKFYENEAVELPSTDEMKVTVSKMRLQKMKTKVLFLFSFEKNSDEQKKISAREDDYDGNIKITIKEADDEDLKPEDKEEDINLNPYSQYKMPTF